MAKPLRIFTAEEEERIITLYKQGKTDKEVAQSFGLARTTFLYAIKTNGLIDDVKKAKEIPDQKVEKSLFKRAIGYTYTEKKIEKYYSKIKETTTKKEVPGDVTACIFWLCNRMPERWRNRQQVEYKGELLKQIIIVTNQGMEDKLGKRLGEATDSSEDLPGGLSKD